jgi:hypothetical protein
MRLHGKQNGTERVLLFIVSLMLLWHQLWKHLAWQCRVEGRCAGRFLRFVTVTGLVYTVDNGS